MPVSFGRAWEATVEVMAKQNLTMQQIDRSSGYISFMPSLLGDGKSKSESLPHAWADCGSGPTGFGHEYPTAVNYNVIVRGDSAVARVLVSARFVAEKRDCVSRGVMEQEFEGLIAKRVQELTRPK